MKNLLICLIACVACACAQSKPKADAKLNDPPAAGEDTVALPNGPPVVRSSDSPAETPSDAEAPAESGADDGAAFVTRADLDAFLDHGPSYVLTIVTVEPMHGDKGFMGYQITEVSHGARTFMTPQLRVGDVVTHVNGVRLLRPEDFMQAWRSLDKVTSIRIDFTRQGEAAHASWAVK